MTDAKSFGAQVDTNDKGVAVLNLFENRNYLVYANGKLNQKDFHAPPVEVLVDKTLKPLKLVLSKEGYGYDDDEKPPRKTPQPQ
jgi:hypothetical protein